MTSVPPLPALAAARAYLHSRGQGLEPLGAPHAAPGDDPGDCATQASRVTPDLALDALMMLRLGRALLQADMQITPAPGCLVVFLAAQEDDRDRVSSCLPYVAPQHWARPICIVLERQDRARTYESSIEREVCDGNAVAAVCDRPESLPEGLHALVLAQIQVPPPDAAMIAALLEILHPGTAVAVDLPDPDIRRLSAIQLAPVFAAQDATLALAQLRRICATHVPAGHVTLGDVHGQPEARAALGQVVTDLADWQAGLIHWAEVSKSFLLVGPPGTGKTLLATALAGSARVPLVKTSYSECQRLGHQGDMLAALHKSAEKAIRLVPSVFFLDEIDSFYRRDRPGSGYILGVVNGLLTLLDRLSATAGVILIAATNNAQRVDPAVIRPGRFDRYLHIGPLDRAGLRDMLRAQLSDGVLSDARVDPLIDDMLGLSGASIAAMLRDARTRARAAHRPLAFEDVLAAVEAGGHGMDPGILWLVSVHEAGHLLVGHLIGLPPALSAQVTVRGGQVVRPRSSLMGRAEVQGWLRTLLAGRVAEEMVFGDISTGSGDGSNSDLAQATLLAQQAEVTFGFGPTLSWESADAALSQMPIDVRARVETALRAAAEDARELLAQHCSALVQVARVLHARREMDAPALAALLAEVAPRPHSGCIRLAGRSEAFGIEGSPT